MAPPASPPPGGSSVPSASPRLCVEHFGAATLDVQSLLLTPRLRDQQGCSVCPARPSVLPLLLVTGVFITLCGEGGEGPDDVFSFLSFLRITAMCLEYTFTVPS